MSRVPLNDYEVEPGWNLLGSAQTAPTPSWLAPAYDSSTFPVSRSVAPPADLIAERAPSHGPPSIRLVSSLRPPRVPEFEPASPEPPPYPDLREEIAVLRAQLAASTQAVSVMRRAILSASEEELVRLSCAIAERIARRELTVDPTIVIGWVREASDALLSSDPLLLVVSPDLAAVVDEAAFKSALANIATVEVDPSFATMRCEVRTRVSRVDASLEHRLAAIAEDLGVTRA